MCVVRLGGEISSLSRPLTDSAEYIDSSFREVMKTVPNWGRCLASEDVLLFWWNEQLRMLKTMLAPRNRRVAHKCISAGQQQRQPPNNGVGKLFTILLGGFETLYGCHVFAVTLWFFFLRRNSKLVGPASIVSIAMAWWNCMKASLLCGGLPWPYPPPLW